jgi:hypothetical protein
MNIDTYKELVQEAISEYILSDDFYGYFYPGQFYAFAATHKKYEAITIANSYRWMLSLEEECADIDTITFSKLSPSASEGRAGIDKFKQLFDLAIEWHRSPANAKNKNIGVHIALALKMDRTTTSNEISRYFGGLKNLTFLASKTNLDADMFPHLTRAHYKKLVCDVISTKTQARSSTPYINKLLSKER